MIASVLQDVIKRYNEIGIYFSVNGYLWWCNGKRLEKWCSCNGNRVTMKNRDVCVYFDFKYWILNGTRFKLLHDLPNLKNTHTVKIGNDEYFYTYFYHHQFSVATNGHKKVLPTKKNPSRSSFLMHNKDHLYYFDNITNEKYNIKTQEWTNFSIPFSIDASLFTIHDIHILDNVFYICYSNGKIDKYDPHTDTWKLNVFYI